MKKESELPQDKFDELLSWLDPEREKAGEKYLRIREGLLRYFRVKGCYECQSLADETINRVARKLATLDKSQNFSPITYFYGFARNIYLEYLAELRKTPLQLDMALVREQIGENSCEDLNERRLQCLEECLAKLEPGESEMLLAYFSKNRSEKFAVRRRLAQDLGITMGNLHIRVFRLKAGLRECVEECLATN